MNWRQRLKAALRAKAISYEQVGEKLNLSFGAVGHRLNGRIEPSLAEIKVMCEMAGISIAELVSDSAFLVADKAEITILEKIRELSPDQRQMFERMLGVSRNPDTTPPPNKN